jgi:site-specific DNA recombinase
VTGVHAFFAERIFGPDRAAVFAEQLDGSDVSAAVTQREHAAGLRDRLAETSTRRKRLLRSLELADDLDGELTRDVQARLAELRAEADDVTAPFRELEDSAVPVPTPELLNALPVAGPDLERLPDEQARALFDAFWLEVRYDRATDMAHCRATPTGETLPAAVTGASGDLATIRAVPPTGFEPDGCLSESTVVVEAIFPLGRH